MSLFNPPTGLIDNAESMIDTGIGGVTDAISGFADALIPPDVLASITTEVAKAELTGDFSVVAELLSQFTEYPADILENLLSESNLFSGFSLDIGSLVNDFLGNLTDYGQFIQNFANDIFSDFSGGLNGFLEGIVADSGGGAKEVIQGIADRPVPDAVKAKVIEDLKNGDIEAASASLAPYSDLNISVLQLILEQLNVTIAGTIVLNSTVGIFPPSYGIGSNIFEWSGESTDEFTFITSEQELDAEIRGISREITELVIHHTDTYTNANLVAGQIHDIHVALGHEGIGYHYIIRRDGSLQRGRPVELEGEHCPTNGHNERSVAIAFVGGLNVSTSDSLIEEFSSAAALTRQQFNTFNKIIEKFYLHYPGLQVLGHNDIDPNEQDPGFDVPEYCFNKFNKINLFTDPTTQGPFTVEQINNFATEIPESVEFLKNYWALY